MIKNIAKALVRGSARTFQGVEKSHILGGVVGSSIGAYRGYKADLSKADKSVQAAYVKAHGKDAAKIYRHKNAITGAISGFGLGAITAKGALTSYRNSRELVPYLRVAKNEGAKGRGIYKLAKQYHQEDFPEKYIKEKGKGFIKGFVVPSVKETAAIYVPAIAYGELHARTKGQRKSLTPTSRPNSRLFERVRLLGGRHPLQRSQRSHRNSAF